MTRRLILWLLDTLFYEELTDAYCRGYARGYLACREDGKETFTLAQLRKYLELDEDVDLDVGGTDCE